MSYLIPRPVLRHGYIIPLLQKRKLRSSDFLSDLLKITGRWQSQQRVSQVTPGPPPILWRQPLTCEDVGLISREMLLRL